jgi:hypothetical protein
MVERNPPYPEYQIAPGALVEIHSGPLAGLRGVIVKSATGNRFVVKVEFIQRGASVILDGSAIRRLVCDETPRESSPSAGESTRRKPTSWLGTLALFGRLLPRKTRKRVFTPAYEEIKEDYLEACKLCTPWKRRWLSCCLVFRTGLMVADCFRALLVDRAVRLFWR